MSQEPGSQGAKSHEPRVMSHEPGSQELRTKNQEDKEPRVMNHEPRAREPRAREPRAKNEEPRRQYKWRWKCRGSIVPNAINLRKL